MDIRALKEFDWYPDGVTRQRKAKGDVIRNVRRGQANGMIDAGLVEAVWPEGDPPTRTAQSAPPPRETTVVKPDEEPAIRRSPGRPRKP